MVTSDTFMSRVLILLSQASASFGLIAQSLKNKILPTIGEAGSILFE